MFNANVAENLSNKESSILIGTKINPKANTFKKQKTVFRIMQSSGIHEKPSV